MKVERKEKAFEPVVITLENAAELENFKRIVGFAADNFGFNDPPGKLADTLWIDLKNFD